METGAVVVIRLPKRMNGSVTMNSATSCLIARNIMFDCRSLLMSEVKHVLREANVCDDETFSNWTSSISLCLTALRSPLF